jgi:hypothetical protein
LAIIDQYFVTCSRRRWQQWSSLKVAHRLTALFTIIWILHNTLFLVYYDLYQSPVTGQFSCVISNTIVLKYQRYFFGIIVTILLPAVISVLFACMVYRNIQQLSYRTAPLVRRELDKQLTIMVLIQIIVFFWLNLPYAIADILALNINNDSDPVVAAIIQFALTMSTIFFYFYYAVSVN